MKPLTPQERVRALQLFNEHSEIVLKSLGRLFPHADLDDLSDAVTKAIMQVTIKGVIEDPTRGTMFSLLRRVARCRYQDRLLSHKRRQVRERKKTASDVTKRETVSNDPGKPMTDHELVTQYFQELAHTEEEAQYLRLWMEGRTDVEMIDLLQSDITNREERAKRVKQLDERIRQRISRLRKRVAREDQP
jgi:hypothetical protein